MGKIFKRPNYNPPVANGIRVTKSLYGVPIPVWYGRTRGPIQLIWTGNFKKHSSGKKGKGGNNYTMNADMMLGYGPMQGIGATWLNTEYFQGLLQSANFTTGTGTTFNFTLTPPGGADLTIVIGVVASLPFSVTYNDYGNPLGSQSFSGNSPTPLPNQLYPAPNSGDWQYAGIPYAKYNSVVGDTNVTVVFPSSVSSIPITVYYMTTVRDTNGGGTDAGVFAFESSLGNAGEGAPLIYADFSGVGVSDLKLGSTPVMPNLSFEGYGLFSYGQTGDANPADIVIDIICSGNNLVMPLWGQTFPPPVWQHGLNLNKLNVPILSTGGAGSPQYNAAYSRYGGILDDEPNLWSPTYSGGSNIGLANYRAFCQSYGIFLSKVLDTQTQASQILDQIMEMTQSAACWDGAQLKIIPYCEISNFGNGASYVSPSAAGPVATLTDDDFIQVDAEGNPKPPVTVERSRPQQDYNSLTINFTDRANGQVDPVNFPNGGGSYNQNSVVITDQADVMVQGPIAGSSKDFSWIHDLTLATNAGLAALRRNSIVKRKKFTWTVQPRFGYLSLMDLVLVTEKSFPNSPFPARITKIVDNPNFSLDMEAEPFIYGGSQFSPTGLTPQTGSGTPIVNQNVDPGSVNTPIIFEAIPSISTQPELWLCLSGANANYGGCDVWLSTDGGSTYNNVGRIYGQQTMGLVFFANYPSHADPDNANTLDVDLTQSFGTLSSFTTTQRDAFLSLCYVDPGGTVTANGQTLTIPYELVAYATANLGSAHQYALVPTTRRGVFGTPITAHNIGQKFSFLNDGIVFKLPMLQAWIGVTLHFKFTAFNQFSQNEQTLAQATDYTFTPTGLVGWTWSAGGTPVGNVPYPTGGVNPSTPPNLANDVYSYVPGTYTGSQELIRVTPSRQTTFPINLTGSIATCDTAPTGSVQITIQKNGVSIGTVNFAASATTGTFTFSSAVTFNGTSDVLKLIAPSVQDATFAGAAIALWATRSN